jgi:hypothetical protein
MPPAVAIYGGNSGNTQCSGSLIGELWIGTNHAPPVSTATTQCVRVSQQSLTHVKIVALNAGTAVSHPRFVSGCACPRRLIRKTTCGYEGSDSGACE